jgi:hypothetical protein
MGYPKAAGASGPQGISRCFESAMSSISLIIETERILK